MIVQAFQCSIGRSTQIWAQLHHIYTTFKSLHIYTGDRLQWMARQQANRPLHLHKRGQSQGIVLVMMSQYALGQQI